MKTARSTGALAAILAALLATACSTSAPSEPTPTVAPTPPTLQSIVFVGTDFDVSTVRRDGSGLRTLVAPGDVPVGGETQEAAVGYTWPTWSPDGRHVALSRIPGLTGESVASLVVLEADGSNERQLHVTNPGFVNLVAEGAPHYTHWAPSGERLSFVAPRADGTGLGLFEVAIAGGDPYLVAEDAPLYHVWSPDSSGMLLHRRQSLLVHSVVDRSTVSIRRDSSSYRVPAYSWDGAWMAYVADIGRGEQLIAWSPGTSIERELWSVSNEVAFAWSPTESILAATQRVQPFAADYAGLALLDAETGQAKRVYEGNLRAFFWSPDGSRIAIVARKPSDRYLEWVVVDFLAATTTSITPFVPSDDYSMLIQFFDQFAPSHSPWSADSSALLFAGIIPGSGQVAQRAPSEVWVAGASGDEPPRALAPGRLAFWIPPLAP